MAAPAFCCRQRFDISCSVLRQFLSLSPRRIKHHMTIRKRALVSSSFAHCALYIQTPETSVEVHMWCKKCRISQALHIRCCRVARLLSCERSSVAQLLESRNHLEPREIADVLDAMMVSLQPHGVARPCSQLFEGQNAGESGFTPMGGSGWMIGGGLREKE